MRNESSWGRRCAKQVIRDADARIASWVSEKRRKCNEIRDTLSRRLFGTEKSQLARA
ncbi:hypothetical protein COLSTE_00310 [Collinsella stercoris DSM 13279]|uniref:Uncharacterized protein n=1 Tax=Collinsella stercoris DSM 13279 TaxID=445975 RepID=B6G8C0_9ACTN|nr:hypothetical protein COLSTE_00310 [Collinsella stercoris DSM 13279]